MEIILGGFLWAPSKQYWHDIIDFISKDYEIIRIKKYKFASMKDLERVIIKLYEDDNIPLDKIKKVKVKALDQYAPVCLNFYFKIKNPITEDYHGRMIVPEVIKMKQQIRKKYKKHINNYKKDIIIHISDNPQQTDSVDNLIDSYIRKKQK